MPASTSVASPFLFDPTGLRLNAGKGLAIQVYEALRDRILSGSIDPRVKLPTTRELALALQISRTTVVRAYDQLYAEGYISARVGDGTYVSAPASALTRPANAGSSTPQLSQLAQHLEQRRAPPAPAGAPCAFRLGLPPLDLFPSAIWSRLQADFWRHSAQHRIGYGDPAGDLQLRSMLAGYLRHARGLVCDPEHIIITAGTQQAIFTCAQLLLNPGELAAIENPGYQRAGAALALAGARLCGIAVDAEGLVTGQLQAHSAARLVYVTPSNQYPTGVTLSLARRLELLAWAERSGGYILEDDYDGEYRYSGTPLALLTSLDRAGRVLYMGTFSKIAFPGLRLGYIVAPAALAAPLANLRGQYDRHSSCAEQAVMAEFIAQGHFHRHVRRMRRASRARRDTLLSEWERLRPGGVLLPDIAAGLHCCAPLESAQREQALIAAAHAAGVEVSGLSRFWFDQSEVAGSIADSSGLVMGFGSIDEAAIARAVKTLQQAWRHL